MYIVDTDEVSVVEESAPTTDFSTEFAKFLEKSSVPPADNPITRECRVRLSHVDISPRQRHHLNMEAAARNSSPATARNASPIARNSSPTASADTAAKEVIKRDNGSSDGPFVKRPKNSEDVIIIEADVSKSPDTPVTKTVTKSPPKGDSKLSEVSKVKSDKMATAYKPLTVDTGTKKPEGTLLKPTSKSNSTSNYDRTDRTSLLSLEQKLLVLQQEHQQKAKSHDNHQKIKSMSPSSGIKTSKDNHHRRTEAFVLERKKSLSSPVKKVVKKPYSAPSTPKENKLGGLFCPTTDAKVTIVPCKSNPKDGDIKPMGAGSNSVTITKVSSGDSLSVPAKDIKKVFSPRPDGKLKMSSTVRPKLSTKMFSKTGDKLKMGEKGERLHKDPRHKDKESRARESSKDGRERRERVGSLKIIRCSKCREVFSTKEAKKLHTCNSILDAHYLIDGGDRQKTSPVSSASNSDRSESTSASLSRSSSRSSSPGIPLNNTVKKGDSPKPKAAKKLDDDKIAKVKISLAKVKHEEDERKKVGDKVKKDGMREKWVETKPGKTERDMEMENRTQGLIIEAIHMEEEKGKEEGFAVDNALFSFSGKRTYSPSMSENTHVDGKGKSKFFY